MPPKMSKMSLKDGVFKKELVMPNGEVKVFEYEKKEPSFNDMINANAEIQKEYLDEWRELSEYQYTDDFEDNIKDKMGQYMKYKRTGFKTGDRPLIRMGGYIVAVTDKFIALKNPIRNLTFSVQYSWLLEAFIWKFPEKEDKDEVAPEIKKAQKIKRKQLKEQKKKEEKELKDQQKKDKEIKEKEKKDAEDEKERNKPVMLTDEQAEEVLTKAYYEEDMKFGRDKLYKTMKANGHLITRKQTDDFLKKQVLYQLSKPAFESKDFIVQTSNAPNNIWNIDLVEIEDKVVMNCVDRFSRFLYSRILRNKTAKQVINALKSIFRNEKPKTIISDNGPEFKSIQTQDFLKQQNIKQVFSTPHQPWSNGSVEVINKTMKDMFKKMTYQKTENKIVFNQSVLNRIIKAYNNSVHATTELTPTNALKEENWEQVRKLNEKHLSVGTKKKQADDIDIGSQVRISLNKGADKKEKKFRTNWSEEVFFVKSINRGTGMKPILYKIEDGEGVSLAGMYKREEIQPIKYTDNADKVDVPYEIRRFVKEQGSEIEVAYRGYNKSNNRWIEKSILKADLGNTVYNKLYAELNN